MIVLTGGLIVVLGFLLILGGTESVATHNYFINNSDQVDRQETVVANWLIGSVLLLLLMVFGLGGNRTTTSNQLIALAQFLVLGAFAVSLDGVARIPSLSVFLAVMVVVVSFITLLLLSCGPSLKGGQAVVVTLLGLLILWWFSRENRPVIIDRDRSDVTDSMDGSQESTTETITGSYTCL